MQPEIRPATAEDAVAGAWCHLLCWREAYAGLVPADLLLERTSDIDRRTERWTTPLGAGRTRWIALNPDPGAAVEERVVGFVGTGPGRDEDSPVPFELEAIYTRQAFWRTGLGGRLFDVAVGKQPAFLWVFEGNARARSFYQRQGFAPDGADKHDPYFDLREIRMVRSQTGPGATGTHVTPSGDDVSRLKHSRRTGATHRGHSGPTDPPDR